MTNAILEKEFNLKSIFRLEAEDKNIGGYLLKKGGAYRIVFLFQCLGIPPYIPEERIDEYIEPIETGIRKLIGRENLTFHQSFFRNTSAIEQDVAKTLEQGRAPEVKFLALSRLKNTRKITKQGLRQEGKIIISVTYTPESRVDPNNDSLDKLVKTITTQWEKYFGSEVKDKEKIFDITERCYHEGYQPWLNILRNSMGLKVRPLSDQEAYLYLEEKLIGASNVRRKDIQQEIKIPQLIIYNQETKELRRQKNSNITTVSKILSQLPSTIQRNRDHVKVGKKHIGILSFTDKPTSARNKRAKLKYLWKIINQFGNFDNEVIVQMSLGDKSLVIEEQENITTQSIDDAKYAQKKGKIDFQAKKRLAEAEEAATELYNDVEVINVTGVILVHRDSHDRLVRDCETMQSTLQDDFSLYREDTYAFKTWPQTIPICWSRLLRSPYDRYQPYLSNEIGFMLPIIMPQAAGKRGMEYIAENGVPIYFDTARYRSHTLILGTQGSSKSVTVSQLIVQQLIDNIPVIVFDIPKDNGYSSHKGLCDFLGEHGAYIDVARERINLFELPDLEQIPSEGEREAKKQEFKDFLVEIMTRRIMNGENSISREMVKSVLILAIERFYSKEEAAIRLRIKQAKEQGFGSDAWNNYPTIKDFIDYVSMERIKISGNPEEIQRTVDFIQLQLKAWIRSGVGRMIASPTTINTNAKMIVYALTGINNREDMEIVMMAAHLEVKRKTLVSKMVTIVNEEMSVSMQYDTNLNAIADYCLNGGKSGIQVVLSGQTTGEIEHSPRCADILDNLTTRIIGFMQSSAVKRVSKAFDYPEDLLKENASQTFAIDPNNLSSRWLVDTNGTLNKAQLFCDPVILGLTANQNNQVEMRETIMARHQDKYDGCLESAREIVNAIQN